MFVTKHVSSGHIETKCQHFTWSTFAKKLKQCQEIKQNWTKRENFDICFWVVLTTTAKVFFLEGRLGTRLCLHLFLRLSNIS